MNRFLLLLAVTVIVEGCGLINSRYLRRDFEIGKVMEAPVGSPMLRAESGFRNDIYKSVVIGQQFELVYGGLARGIIKLTYREFDLDKGRPLPTPVYTQDLQYDLDNSKIIAFRKTLIEVMSAASDKIVYRVLEDPDPTEFD